jgi:chemotaxis family two-component system response regulator Rcp1
VLLAEDNLPDALLVREVIRMQNLPLDVHVADDGEKAIDFIARSDEAESAAHPDLLIVDLNLPRMDGFEVLARLRESPRSKAIPVLILTSSDSPTDRAQAAKLGARYFQKPPSYQEFLKLGEVLKEIVLKELVGDSTPQ